MRLVLRGLIVAILALWLWLAVSGSALLVWQAERALWLRCHYITALDLIEAQYFHDEGNPLGRRSCPLVIAAPEDLP